MHSIDASRSGLDMGEHKAWSIISSTTLEETTNAGQNVWAVFRVIRLFWLLCRQWFIRINEQQRELEVCYLLIWRYLPVRCLDPWWQEDEADACQIAGIYDVVTPGSLLTDTCSQTYSSTSDSRSHCPRPRRTRAVYPLDSPSECAARPSHFPNNSLLLILGVLQRPARVLRTAATCNAV